MLKGYSTVILLISVLLLVSSCANYKLHQSQANNISKITPPNSTSISHSIYLIGGAGMTTPNPTLKLLKDKLDKAPKNTSVLFLGDNVGELGMPSMSNVDTA